MLRVGENIKMIHSIQISGSGNGGNSGPMIRVEQDIPRGLMAAGGGEGGIETVGVAGEGVGLKYRWVVSRRLHL